MYIFIVPRICRLFNRKKMTWIFPVILSDNVLGGKNFDPTDVFSIADELHDLSGKDVDVYEEREIDISSEFYKNILKDGIRF